MRHLPVVAKRRIRPLDDPERHACDVRRRLQPILWPPPQARRDDDVSRLAELITGRARAVDGRLLAQQRACVRVVIRFLFSPTQYRCRKRDTK